MTARDLRQVSIYDVIATHGYRRAAIRRLARAKAVRARARFRSSPVQRFAQREYDCALAEAQEWGVAGRRLAR